jgi:hypothetical protein
MSSCLTDLVNEHALDFIGFQETMKKEYSSKFFRRLNPGGILFWKWVASVGKAGGILCGVRHETLSVLGFKMGKYILRFDLWDNLKKCKWSLLVVYGSAHEEFKNEFLVEMSSFYHEVDSPYIIGGDFNIIRHCNEKNKCHSVVEVF